MTKMGIYTRSHSIYKAGRLLLLLAVSLFWVGGSSHAAAPLSVAPDLGTAASFAVLGGQAVTNTDTSVVTGNLGVAPGTAITGFPPGIVLGEVHAADAVALQAQQDAAIAYTTLAGEVCNTNLTGHDLGGLTLTPGVYCFSSSAQLTGPLTLDAQDDPAAVWIFQIGSTLNSASDASVMVINGGNACNVFWQVGSSATLGVTNTFAGTIVALASISLATNTTLSGRALAQNGAVTMDTNAVTLPTCATPTAIEIGSLSTTTPPTPPILVPFILMGGMLVLAGLILRRQRERTIG